MMSTLHIKKFKSNPEVFLKDELWFHDKSLILKYREVRRMLHGTELKYWYSCSKFGQRPGVAQVREQSIAAGSGHLVQPSALQPTGKHHQAPQSLPALCPCRQTRERLQIHNHSPMRCCRVLPTPKLNSSQHTTSSTSRTLTHLTFWPGTKTYSFPPTIRTVCKEEGEEKKKEYSSLCI